MPEQDSPIWEQGKAINSPEGIKVPSPFAAAARVRAQARQKYMEVFVEQA